MVAHFARFSTSNLTALKLLTQENVLVGGFFVISGYVSAYTTTKLGALGVEEKKVANPELFFWQRATGLAFGEKILNVLERVQDEGRTVLHLFLAPVHASSC